MERQGAVTQVYDLGMRFQTQSARFRLGGLMTLWRTLAKRERNTAETSQEGCFSGTFFRPPEFGAQPLTPKP